MREKLTTGQKVADFVASKIGSWNFLLIQSFLLILWIIFNATQIIPAWDNYPFILLNLILSLQAAYTAPLIMISQNRQAVKDRQVAHEDLLVDKQSLKEIKELMDHLEDQQNSLMEIRNYLINKARK